MLLEPIDKNDEEFVVLAVPWNKTDKELNGRRLRIPPANIERLSPAYWIHHYIRLSSSHRTVHQMKYLFIPLKSSKTPTQEMLCPTTISNQVKDIIEQSEVLIDHLGNKITPSSIRKSTQTRVRRAGGTSTSSATGHKQPVLNHMISTKYHCAGPT